jgi:hypothetical protein
MYSFTDISTIVAGGNAPLNAGLLLLVLKVTKGDMNFLVALRQAMISDATPSLYP